MRWRVLFFVSMGVNIALAAVWLAVARRVAGHDSSTSPGPITTVSVKTNFVVRRQFFSWQEVESQDYPTYIANLRDIGCPEQTVRDIIIADVNGLYARRRATELVTPEQQWWRSEPDREIVRAAAEKARTLDDERRALLTRLLGPNWEGGDLANLPRPSRPSIALDGPILGVLAPDIKQAVQDINSRGEERLQAYLDAQRSAGKNPDPAELARLRRQTRDELAGVLTPQQLEEFLLRYSQDANSLRTEFGQLKYFDATPDEFRAVFRATDAIDQQLQLLAGSNDPNSVAQRNALEQQRQDAIKMALGSDRYEEFSLLHDPLYQQATATAEQAGYPDAVQALYEINLATAVEQDRIRANTNLTAEQLAIELKRSELQQLIAVAQATGQDVPPEPAPAPQPTVAHVVTMGETLISISQMYGVPMAAIRDANPGFDVSKMKVGDWIRVPQPAAPPAQ
jgi:LysM repeat protein